MSAARRLSVLPSVVSSVREEGMPVELRRAISSCIKVFPPRALDER